MCSIKGAPERQNANSAELVLDGQQRLTALWGAFKGDTELLVKVRNWNDEVLEFEDIWTLRETGIRGRPDNVTAAAFYEKQCFPFAILGIDSVTQDKDAGWKWCNKAMKDAGEAARVLWNKINYDFGEPLRNRDLWYLRLPASMSRKDAIDVYVKTNQSSAIIRKFDIAVALYDSQTDSSLRDEIVDMVREVAQGGELIRRFLGPANNDFDEDDLIPELGELLLKVACLWTDLPPTERNYTKDKVLKTLRNKTQDFRDALIWSLEFYSQEGIPRRQFVPSYVPLRVLPALQPMLAKIPQKHKRKAIRVVRAYLWRAFLTDRYARSANTRLHEDYKELKKALENPEALPEALDDTNLRKISPIFHKDDFRLPSVGILSDLSNPLPKPHRKKTLSRAVFAIGLRKAHDFGTGELLIPIAGKDCDRHHLFPEKYLTDNGVSERKRIDHCLNFALITAETNGVIRKQAPHHYLSSDSELTHDRKGEELKRLVESQLIPFEALSSVPKQKRSGAPDVEKAYQLFIEARARVMIKAIDKLARGEIP